jgi:hypothetical protein
VKLGLALLMQVYVPGTGMRGKAPLLMLPGVKREARRAAPDRPLGQALHCRQCLEPLLEMFAP